MVEQLTLPLKLNSQINFENYIIGDNTELVFRLKNLCRGERTDALTNGFIYIWGEPGTGKTHLTYATYLTALENKQPAFYLSLKNHSQYQPTIFEALEQNKLIYLDDIDAIAGDKLWEEALFHLYNRIREKNHFLVVTALKPSVKVSWILADLKSRLNSALSYHLKSLTDADKILALTAHTKAKGMHIAENVWDYILTNYSRDMQTLTKILQQLEQQSLIQKKRVTIPFVKEIVGATSWSPLL